MHSARSTAALSCLLLPLAAATAHAQTVTEITAMTVPSSAIDMDLVGAAGPTTIALVNAAGSGCGAALADIVLTPSTAVQGIYDTNVTRGRALGRDTASNGLVLLDPQGAFGAFDAQIEFALDCTEFGVGIGDWVGGMLLDFFSKGIKVATFTTSTYSTANPKFFQMTGGTFDRVDIKASAAVGNWVIPDLITQIPSNGLTPYGKGCAGSSGKIPYLAANPGSVAKVGNTLALTVSNAPTVPGPVFFVLGSSDTMLGTLTLPVDLALIGAPGCRAWTDPVLSFGSVNIGGTAPFSLALPNSQSIVGAQAYLQPWLFDSSANVLGLIAANAGHLCVLP